MHLDETSAKLGIPSGLTPMWNNKKAFAIVPKH
jgi:hypothetical protein